MPRPDVRDQRIPQILDAAARVFAANGIDGASVSQIAKASGVSKATIYHYFDSKEVVVGALIERLFAADQPSLDRIVSSDAPAAERLRAYSRELVALIEENRVLWPVIAEVRARANRLEFADDVLRRYFERYVQVFSDVIQQGMDRMELRATLRADHAALAYVALVEGALLIAEHTHTSLGDTMCRSVEVFLEGLA